jgi:hypothetical protein
MHRREYKVSPRCRFQMAGPMKMENSFTLTLNSLAVRKCPSSWTMIRMPKIKIAKRIYRKYKILAS